MAIPGGTVCHYHGGAAPQVQQKAKERLAALVDPAINRLTKLLKAKNEKVALGAVKDVLDRNGFKPSVKVDPGEEGGIVISWQDAES
jgi:phosphopentomutase